MFINREDGDLQYGHNKELHRASFTQNGSKGDQDCCCAEICVDYSATEGKEHNYNKLYYKYYKTI